MSRQEVYGGKAFDASYRYHAGVVRRLARELVWRRIRSREADERAAWRSIAVELLLASQARDHLVRRQLVPIRCCRRAIRGLRAALKNNDTNILREFQTKLAALAGGASADGGQG